MRPGILLLTAAFVLAGCAPTSKYDWGDYSPALLHSYQSPKAAAAYKRALAHVIAGDGSGEPSADAAANPRVPPGIYAEYGHVLLTEGDTKEAIRYFGLEKSRWPESAVFMDRTIQNIQQGGASPLPPQSIAAQTAPVVTLPEAPPPPVAPPPTPALVPPEPAQTSPSPAPKPPVPTSAAVSHPAPAAVPQHAAAPAPAAPVSPPVARPAPAPVVPAQVSTPPAPPPTAASEPLPPPTAPSSKVPPPDPNAIPLQDLMP